MFTCVSAILGLEADPRQKTLYVEPIETPLWNRIEVRGLHFAGARIDLSVVGTEARGTGLPAGFQLKGRR
jgi:hypothetical protein